MKVVKNKYSDLSDEELMSFYQNGEFQAFQTIYTRHAGRVFEYLKKKVSPDLAQDLLQESFEKLHRNRDKYNSQYPFLPWIFTISRNVVIDYYKKAESKLVKASCSSDDFIESLSAPLLENSSNMDISDVLRALPIAQKRAIELRYMNDWSFAQIATELETSEDNIRQLVSRGIKKLRSSFNKTGGSSE